MATAAEVDRPEASPKSAFSKTVGSIALTVATGAVALAVGSPMVCPVGRLRTVAAVDAPQQVNQILLYESLYEC